MAKKKARPAGGRPPSRRGRGGVGPGPGYRPNPNTGGTRHTGNCMTAKVVGAAILGLIAASLTATAAAAAGVL
jgi:hypothetical protein